MHGAPEAGRWWWGPRGQELRFVQGDTKGVLIERALGASALDLGTERWSHWAGWCAAHGHCALVASVELLATFGLAQTSPHAHCAVVAHVDCLSKP